MVVLAIYFKSLNDTFLVCSPTFYVFIINLSVAQSYPMLNAMSRFLLNPSLASEENMVLFRFLGILFGVAVRTKKPLDLHLAPCVWKLLTGMPLKVEDMEEVGTVTSCGFSIQISKK